MFLIEGIVGVITVIVGIYGYGVLKKLKLRPMMEFAELQAKAVANKICPKCGKMSLQEQIVGRYHAFESQRGLGVCCTSSYCGFEYKYPAEVMKQKLKEQLAAVQDKRAEAILKERV